MEQFISKALLQRFSARYSYPVIFTTGVFQQNNPVLRDIIETSGVRRRYLLVLDSGLLTAMPDLPGRIENYLGRPAGSCVVRGGEACKNGMAEVRFIRRSLGRLGLCRHSFVLTLGGGAVLDVAGYAAATAHRGIHIIRLPTTTLSQNDSGVGVKNGVNAFGRKNFVGTFAPPLAVINDFDFLKTLPDREKRAGIAEAVKVALIRDAHFFEFLHAERSRLGCFDPDIMEYMITRCAELHLEHIRSGDPFERGSSRPLDFGHWSAHKLEEITSGEMGHGEAVAAGIALDSLYSWKRGLVAERDMERILDVLEAAGFSVFHPALLQMNVSRALSDFQEHLGGHLTVPLINGIGSRIDVHEIDLNLYRQCIHQLAARKGAYHDGNKVPDDGRRDPGYVLS